MQFHRKAGQLRQRQEAGAGMENGAGADGWKEEREREGRAKSTAY